MIFFIFYKNFKKIISLFKNFSKTKTLKIDLSIDLSMFKKTTILKT